MNYRTRSIAAALAVLTAGFALTGCDDEDDLTLTDTALYAAALTALNGSGVTGAAAFEVSESGDFAAGVEVLSLADGQGHAQHVHAGAACPASSADADADGLIDLGEGVADYGLILIPLDDNLADPGLNGFPSGPETDYDATVAYATLMAHLSAADPDPGDNLVTLNGADLELEERTVVIHGAWVLNGQVVAGGTQGATYDATLPVACGAIDRVGPTP